LVVSELLVEKFGTGGLSLSSIVVTMDLEGSAAFLNINKDQMSKLPLKREV
jgi:hypothetical protein